MNGSGWWNGLITDVLYKDYFSEAFKVYLGSVPSTSYKGKVLQGLSAAEGIQKFML